jgi:hypothetical protein
MKKKIEKKLWCMMYCTVLIRNRGFSLRKPRTDYPLPLEAILSPSQSSPIFPINNGMDAAAEEDFGIFERSTHYHPYR